MVAQEEGEGREVAVRRNIAWGVWLLKGGGHDGVISNEVWQTCIFYSKDSKYTYNLYYIKCNFHKKIPHRNP